METQGKLSDMPPEHYNLPMQDEDMHGHHAFPEGGKLEEDDMDPTLEELKCATANFMFFKLYLTTKERLLSVLRFFDTVTLPSTLFSSVQLIHFQAK